MKVKYTLKGEVELDLGDADLDDHEAMQGAIINFMLERPHDFLDSVMGLTVKEKSDRIEFRTPPEGQFGFYTGR